MSSVKTYLRSPKALLLFCALCVGCGGGFLKPKTTPEEAPPDNEALRLFVSGADQLERGGNRQLTRAVEQLSQAVARAPSLWEAHYDLGLARVRLGEREQGCASIEKAHELAPKAPEPLFALIDCALATSDHRRARGLAEQLVAQKPDDPTALLTLCHVQRLAGDLDDALKAARTVLIHNAKDGRALLEVARVYRAKGETEVAELVLQKALAQDEKNALAHNELGLLALERGDTQLAFSHFEKAGALDPKLAASHLNRASVLLRAGDFDGAERAYRQALAAEPANTAAQIGLAIALRGQNKLEAAEREYERILEELPSQTDTLFNLAVLRAEFMDRRKDALPLFERFVELRPSGPEHELAQRYIEDIRMSLGGARDGQ